MKKNMPSFRFVLLVLLFASFTFGQTSRGNSDQILINAQKFLQSGEFDKAIVELSSAILRSPNNITFYFLRGTARFLKGDFRGANDDYNRVIKAAPNAPGIEQIYNNRGVIRHLSGDTNGAFADFNKAISLNPNYAAPYNGRGNILVDKGKLDEAISSFNNAIKLDAKPITAYSGRADAWFKKGELNKALDDFNKFIELNPNTAGEKIRRGMIYGLKRNWKLSVDDLDKGIEINSKAKSPFSGNIKVSLEDLDKFITAYPEIASAYAVRGLIKLLQRKEIAAMQDFDKSFGLDAELKDQISSFIKMIKEKQNIK